MTFNAITEASICNQALSRMGSTQTITSLDISDRSNEAKQARLWYPSDRDAMLNDFPWPWAESYQVLDQVAGPEIDGQVANPQWSRTYRYPSDCLKVRRLVDTQPTLTGGAIPQTTGLSTNYGYTNEPWKRAEGQPYPISFGIGHDATGRLIETDSFGCGFGITCIYTAAVQDPTQFSADFADALAWRLAADFAMGLGFSDSKRQYAEEMYKRVIYKARAALMNEQQSSIPYVRYQSEVTRARWGY